MEEKYINNAFLEAKKAYVKNEVPVGAIIVKEGKIISRAHNKKISTGCIFDHAEILAIKKAAKKLGDWRLNDCVMYVTLEPCPMCASAIQQSRIKKIYIGTTSNIDENKKVIFSILNNPKFNHNVEISYLNDEKCSSILTNFFDAKRR